VENFNQTHYLEKSTREAFGEALVELGSENSNVVVVSADLAESTKILDFAKKFPERFIEVGVAEQNMTGVATGLALSGKIPFMASFGVFSPGRNWDQIRLGVCYNRANVKIVATHTGFSPGKDGATHEALEDIALTRVLPNITIFSPCDFYETKKAVHAAASIVGPVYIRLGRAETPVITELQSTFSIGDVEVLENGKEIALVGTGTIITEGFFAAKEINSKYKDMVKVINCPSIKPLNTVNLLKELEGINHIFTLEEHQISGGFGSLICEIVSENMPRKITRLGMRDLFGESGDYEDLLKKYKLDKESIKNSLIEALRIEND
jgi:transketolase